MGILEIITLIGTITSLVKQYGPSAMHLLDSVPALIKDVQFLYESITSGETLTDEKRAEIRANFEQANEASKALEEKFRLHHEELVTEGK